MRTFGPIPQKKRRGREGAAAVEFALVGPILVLLLIAIVVYGGWFLMAQSVQALASEGRGRRSADWTRSSAMRWRDAR